MPSEATIPRSFSLIPVAYAARRERRRAFTIGLRLAVALVVACAVALGALKAATA